MQESQSKNLTYLDYDKLLNKCLTDRAELAITTLKIVRSSPALKLIRRLQFGVKALQCEFRYYYSFLLILLVRNVVSKMGMCTRMRVLSL